MVGSTLKNPISMVLGEALKLIGILLLLAFLAAAVFIVVGILVDHMIVHPPW